MRRLCVLLLMCPTPAMAQGETTMPDVQAERIMEEFADCLVRGASGRQKAEAFVRIIPGSPTFYPAAQKLSDKRCLTAAAMRNHASRLELRMKPLTLRQALFPALYRASFAGTPPANLTNVPVIDHKVEFDGDLSTMPDFYAGGRALGDCVTRVSPEGVHALLLAHPHEKKETEAIALVKPAIAHCLPPGQTLRLTRGLLRAFMGEAAYRLAEAARARPAAG